MGHVAFHRVSFAYAEDPVLTDVSFTVEPGQILGIVGPTGAGKSTLALLMARLYDPQQGRIEIDGIGLTELEPHTLRTAVNVVPQETFLFPGTIRDNIRYGDPQADDQAVERAAALVQAHDFIAQLPHGYDSQLGEAGAMLSGGQQQLIALARAMLADPLILVLDETTAHVDALAEQRLQEAMGEVARGRTTLIIAHRFSTLRRADRLLVLDQGRVAGLDSHVQLSATNPVYQRLYEREWAKGGATAAGH